LQAIPAEGDGLVFSVLLISGSWVAEAHAVCLLCAGLSIIGISPEINWISSPTLTEFSNP
jgi:hypothetical protein